MRRSLQTPINLAFVWCLTASAATAQHSTWVPLVVSEEVAPEAVTVLDRLSVELRTSGVTLQSGALAKSRARAIVGTAPAHVSEAVAATVSLELGNALAHGAVNEWARADTALATFDALSPLERDAVLALGRVGDKAFLLCIVHAQFNGIEDPNAGLQQAQTCLARYPGQGLAAGSPKVLFELVDNARQAIVNPATLTIAAVGNECVAVVNGTSVGATPVKLAAVPAGTALRVQARCQQMSRVHVLELAAGANELTIDARFDAVVVTDGYLGLRYASGRANRNHMTRDARRVAKAVGATGALIVGSDSAGELWLQRVSDVQSFTRVHISIAPTGADVRNVARELTSLSMEGLKPLVEATVETVETPDETTSILPTVVGIGIFAAGAGGVGLSWAYYRLSGEYRSLSARGSIQYVDAYGVQGERALLFSGLGAAALSLSAPLLLPTQSNDVLTWGAAAIGAVGLGAGVYLTATAEGCSASECRGGETSVYLGPMVLTQSLPFIAIPLTYLVRGWLGDETVNVEVRASAAAVAVGLRGVLF